MSQAPGAPAAVGSLTAGSWGGTRPSCEEGASRAAEFRRGAPTAARFRPWQRPLRDSASGSGHVLQTDFIGGGEAGPNGENPVGSLALSGFLNFTTATTCLNISGNSVVSGGRILTGRDAGEGFLSSSVATARRSTGGLWT